MIYDILELPRCDAAVPCAFGGVDTLFMEDVNDTAVRVLGRKLVHDGSSVTLGVNIARRQDGLPIHLPLVKFLERYTTRTGCPVYIERVCLQDGRAFIPFKLRYRSVDGVKTFVLHRNLKPVYDRLRAAQVEVDWDGPAFIEPKLHLVDVGRGLAMSPQLTDLFSMIHDALRVHAPPGVDLLTPDAYTGQTTLLHLDPFVRAIVAHPDPRDWSKDDLRDLVQGYFLPAIPVVDPLTDRGVEAPLTPTLLRGRFAPHAAVEASPVPALPIADPAGTVHSPDYARDWAEDLDRWAVTDVDVHYLVTPAAGVWVKDRVIGEFADRYAAAFPPSKAALRVHEHYLDQLAHEALEFLDLEPTAPERRAVQRLRIRRTFNEEALIEYFTTAGTLPAFAIHVDLARLSLCSMGTTDGVCANDCDAGDCSCRDV